MILQCNYADESCGLPRVKKPSGRGCGESMKMIAGNSSLSEEAVYEQGKNGHFHSVKTV
jgi:hypothetical protein